MDGGSGRLVKQGIGAATWSSKDARDANVSKNKSMDARK